MNPRKFFVVLFFVVSLPTAFSQMVVAPLSSPVIASGGGGTASPDSPFSDRFNPALSAGKQRVTLDTSYLGLPGFQDSGYGNAFNLGITMPTRWGVLTGTGSYLGAGFQHFNPGNLGQFTLGFSKDLFEDFYIGAAVDSVVGQDGWGVGGSVGFLHLVGDWGFLKNFRWGFALRDMGKGYVTNGVGVPPAFTPALGAEFSLIKEPGIEWVFRPEASFPTFGDVNIGVGTTLALQDFFFINAAWTYDLKDNAAGTAPSLPFSIGLGFKFVTDIKEKIDLLNFSEQGWNRSEVRVMTAAVPLTGGVYGFGGGVNIPLGVQDKTPPAIQTDAKTSYISPNNDGVQDTIDLPVTITDERYVTGYTLAINDGSGKPIRTLQNKVTLPESNGLDSLWTRLTYEKKGVEVPKALAWNGFTDTGSVAPDGTYNLVVTAWDDNGNKRSIEAGSVVVKNAPPQAAAAVSVKEFNPTGPRDRLSVTQNGSTEDLWTGTFKNARDEIVRTVTWKNAAPPNFDWDGKNADGRVVPDGVYSYELSAADRAGNKTATKIGNLIINSLPTPLDLNLNRTAFSPQGNGVKTLVFQPKPGLSAGIVNWKLVVLDAQGKERRTIQGPGNVPAEIEFNGRDQNDQPLSEGDYKARIALEYANGNTPEVLSHPFTIRNTPPQAKVTVPYTVFSPGSEEGRGVITFQQQTSQEETWTGHLETDKGQVIRTIRWPDKADATYLWDGRGADGQILPDGTYHYALEATDKAGNTGKSEPIEIQIDTQKRTVLLSSDRSAFSPGTASPYSKLKLLPQIKVADGLISWDLQVEDSSGKVVKSWTNQPKIQPAIEWDGKDDQGKKADDGLYTATLKVSYKNGTEPTAKSNAFLLKTVAPTITLKAESTIFSPTADSAKPKLVIHQESSNESEWQGRVLKGDTPVKTWSWKGKTPDVTWDGTDNNGNKVADGTYRYEVQASDDAGNKTVQNVNGIVLDSRPTQVFLTVASDGFSPNGDGVLDSIGFSAKVGLTEGISQWKLEMVHDTLGIRKTFKGTGAVPAQFQWDGLNDLQGRSEDGRYTARLQVVYDKGNTPETRSTTFVLQATPPQLAVTLTPLPFSPDNDGSADELDIGLGVKTFAPISEWSLDISDPENHRFTSFAGKGSPSAKLTWDGRSDTGELVQSASDYSLVLQVKDSLGNVATQKKTLPVDVLVIKDGEKLRIIIPSITFLADKPDFLNVEAEKASKNIAVLKRLAEIFSKYSRYNIVVEGHAVMVNWNDPVRGKREQTEELVPLSKSRAEEVKKFLVSLGIGANRISTEGVGGARPLVPFSDADNRWKNRRVEFLLVKD